MNVHAYVRTSSILGHVQSIQLFRVTVGRGGKILLGHLIGLSELNMKPSFLNRVREETRLELFKFSHTGSRDRSDTGIIGRAGSPRDIVDHSGTYLVGKA